MWEFERDGPFDCVCEEGDGLEDEEESASAEGERRSEEGVIRDAEGSYQEGHCEGCQKMKMEGEKRKKDNNKKSHHFIPTAP